MIEPPVPGRKYSGEQMAQMAAAYPSLVMPGYVLRVDSDGMSSIVPWRQASGGGARENGRQVLKPRLWAASKEELFPLEPIKRRTPQQRLDSLSEHMQDMSRLGTLPILQSGVAPRVNLGNGKSRPPTTEEQEKHRGRRAKEIAENEEMTRALVGESWRLGQPITAEHVRVAASRLLGQAENKNEARERKKIVRTAPSD